ncbi:MAG TPA: (d)CMP kinase, partial [Pyrinomonadaceae bacterium]|nr:(d)CMP kinase [Pyrinomonadaceae bacterium]
SIAEAEAVAEVARRSSVELEGDPDSPLVRLDGEDVSREIRGEHVGQTASVISTIPEVRRELVSRQRALGEAAGGAVLDGRDIGTVVFPDAQVKFFLTAAPEERARRRFDEAHQPGQTFDETLAHINERDRRDATRDDSPLKIAEGAVVIDTTEFSADEVFRRMLEIVAERRPGRER